MGCGHDVVVGYTRWQDMWNRCNISNVLQSDTATQRITAELLISRLTKYSIVFKLLILGNSPAKIQYEQFNKT